MRAKSVAADLSSRVPSPLARARGDGATKLLASLVVPALLLTIYFLTQYGDIWGVPFINEDYAFLDMTRGRSLLTLWQEPGLYAGPWFRPWSQGIHYWLLQSMFSTRIEAWHAVSALLWLTILVSYFGLARRLIGGRGAAVATACLAASAAWGVLLTWIAGVQDLWMMVFALTTLHAVVSDRRGLATAAYALALLSKETAALLPVIAMAWELLHHHRSWKEALTRTWPLWVVGVVWIFVHPTHGAMTWLMGARHAPAQPIDLAHAGSAVLQLLNIEALPRPEFGWPTVIARGLLGALPLTALLFLSLRRGAMRVVPRAEEKEPRTTSVIAFGTIWAFVGWVPLVLPGLGWHAYYALFGAMGAWLVIAGVLQRFPPVAIALVVGLSVARAGRAVTPSHDWGEESYVRRAGEFLAFMRSDLLTKKPHPQPHSRFFFDGVPSEVGFLVGTGPSLRIWYEDSTLLGGFYRDFRRRGDSKAEGEDLFFRYDTTSGWIPIVQGPEDVGAAQRLNPHWARDHELVAISTALGGDWRFAGREYEKLALAYPDSALYAFYAGAAALELGDSLTARRWFEAAAKLPSADKRMREAAQSLRLWEPRPAPSGPR